METQPLPQWLITLIVKTLASNLNFVWLWLLAIGSCLCFSPNDCILERNVSEKDFGVSVDNQCYMSAQCNAVAKRANTTLGCRSRGVTEQE